MPEIIVLGLDGANWSLLEPWLNKGVLPNLSELHQDSTATDLKSELPPVTCPNWRCYSTGKNPGKLGVFWWEKIHPESQSLSTPNSHSFKSSDYWNYLNNKGYTAGIFNLPMTYPPFNIEGFMVSGGPGCDQKEYTIPKDIGDKLDSEGYLVHPKNPINSSKDYDTASSVIDLIDDRLTTFRELIVDRPVDVAHCTVFYINVLQHYFWRDEPTRHAWEIIDDHIGAIREDYPDATLILMSDHGCTEIDTVFYANSWLEKMGLLRRQRKMNTVFEHFGINQKKVSSIAGKLGLRGLLSSVTPDRLVKQIPKDEEGMKRKQKLNQVDWENTDAIASGQGLINVFDGNEEIKDKITSRLSSLKRTGSERLIARDVFYREKVYDGSYVEEAPEIIFDQSPGIHTSGAIGDNPIFGDASHWKAENTRTGLFLVDGPSVELDLNQPVQITDIAPTILHAVDCSIPTDMDGNPLDIHDNGEPEYINPIIPQRVEGQKSDSVESRLENLGYLE